ncbi:hypothetical protein B0T19DRAFT_95986 [Cercophora scortea]|uniref:Secreted protein n=1 Tax=Cercophora scortea TaxID=314031 RepID=A0AAE0IVQ6_9PEZI|nr:hypothetical protein B0T19DRAFT_95986 [Cercophora scortea]
MHGACRALLGIFIMIAPVRHLSYLRCVPSWSRSQEKSAARRLLIVLDYGALSRSPLSFCTCIRMHHLVRLLGSGRLDLLLSKAPDFSSRLWFYCTVASVCLTWRYCVVGHTSYRHNTSSDCSDWAR